MQVKKAVGLILIILLSSCLYRNKLPDTRSLIESAGSLVESLAKEDFYEAEKDFSDTLKDSLPPQQLELIWKKTTKDAGAYRKFSNIREGKALHFDVVVVKCEFEREDIDIELVTDAEKKVVGLHFFPVPRS
jgi:uncharacterized protein